MVSLASAAARGCPFGKGVRTGEGKVNAHLAGFVQAPYACYDEYKEYNVPPCAPSGAFGRSGNGAVAPGGSTADSGGI